MASGNHIPRSKIERIQNVYKSSDLDYDDISERFGVSVKDARKYCKDIKKVFKNVIPNPRIEHSLYTPDELIIYRAFQSKEIDAFDEINLNIPLVSSL